MSHTFGFAPRTGSKFFPVQRVAVVPRDRVPDIPTKFIEAFFPFRDVNVYYSDNDCDLSPAEIVENVCLQFGITSKMLTGRGHFKILVEPRRQVAKRLRALGMSTPEIAAVLNRDHTTVLSLLGMLKRQRMAKEGREE